MKPRPISKNNNPNYYSQPLQQQLQHHQLQMQQTQSRNQQQLQQLQQQLSNHHQQQNHNNHQQQQLGKSKNICQLAAALGQGFPSQSNNNNIISNNNNNNPSQTVNSIANMAQFANFDLSSVPQMGQSEVPSQPQMSSFPKSLLNLAACTSNSTHLSKTDKASFNSAFGKIAPNKLSSMVNQLKKSQSPSNNPCQITSANQILNNSNNNNNNANNNSNNNNSLNTNDNLNINFTNVKQFSRHSIIVGNSDSAGTNQKVQNNNDNSKYTRQNFSRSLPSAGPHLLPPKTTSSKQLSLLSDDHSSNSTNNNLSSTNHANHRHSTRNSNVNSSASLLSNPKVTSQIQQQLQTPVPTKEALLARLKERGAKVGVSIGEIDRTIGLHQQQQQHHILQQQQHLQQPPPSHQQQQTMNSMSGGNIMSDTTTIASLLGQPAGKNNNLINSLKGNNIAPNNNINSNINYMNNYNNNMNMNIANHQFTKNDNYQHGTFKRTSGDELINLMEKKEYEISMGQQESKNDLSLLMPTTTLAQNCQKKVNSFSAGFNSGEDTDFLTDEVKRMIMEQCNIIYECKECNNLFRSLANLVRHKKTYCTGPPKEREHTKRSYLSELLTKPSISRCPAPISSQNININNNQNQNQLQNQMQQIQSQTQNSIHQQLIRNSSLAKTLLNENVKNIPNAPFISSSSSTSSSLHALSTMTSTKSLLGYQSKSTRASSSSSILTQNSTTSINNNGRTATTASNSTISIAKSPSSSIFAPPNTTTPASSAPKTSHIIQVQTKHVAPKRKLLEDCIKRVKREKQLPSNNEEHPKQVHEHQVPSGHHLIKSQSPEINNLVVKLTTGKAHRLSSEGTNGDLNADPSVGQPGPDQANDTMQESACNEFDDMSEKMTNPSTAPSVIGSSHRSVQDNQDYSGSDQIDDATEHDLQIDSADDEHDEMEHQDLDHDDDLNRDDQQESCNQLAAIMDNHDDNDNIQQQINEDHDDIAGESDGAGDLDDGLDSDMIDETSQQQQDREECLQDELPEDEDEPPATGPDEEAFMMQNDDDGDDEQDQNEHNLDEAEDIDQDERLDLEATGDEPEDVYVGSDSNISDQDDGDPGEGLDYIDDKLDQSREQSARDSDIHDQRVDIVDGSNRNVEAEREEGDDDLALPRSRQSSQSRMIAESGPSTSSLLSNTSGNSNTSSSSGLMKLKITLKTRPDEKKNSKFYEIV